jgi:hypothetical protein
MKIEKDTDDFKLRKLLWLNHGCSVDLLYGDDGELQCSTCGIDFKRNSVSFIDNQFLLRSLRKLCKPT